MFCVNKYEQFSYSFLFIIVIIVMRIATSRDSQSFVVGLLLMFGAQYSEKEIGEIRALELLNVYNDVTPRTVDKESSMDTPALCSNNDLSLSSEFVKTAQQRSGTSDSPKRTNQSKSFFANLFGSKKVSSSQSPITKTGMTAEYVFKTAS